jgi:hypothetical protein
MSRICCDNCKKCKPESVKPYDLGVKEEVYLCDECFKAMHENEKR